MLRLKPGVRVHGLCPEIVLALIAAHAAYQQRGADCVLTAGIDSTHKRGSLHYAGRAVDLRTNMLKPGEAQAIAVELQDALGPDFDALLETDHLHLEWDPKEAY